MEQGVLTSKEEAAGQGGAEAGPEREHALVLDHIHAGLHHARGLDTLGHAVALQLQAHLHHVCRSSRSNMVKVGRQAGVGARCCRERWRWVPMCVLVVCMGNCRAVHRTGAEAQAAAEQGCGAAGAAATDETGEVSSSSA